MGGLSFRLEEVYVLQSTGGSGLCERLMVIVGWGCEGPSCTFTSCCTGGPGGFRKLPGLWATNKGPPEKAEERKVQFLFMRLTVPPLHTVKFSLFLFIGTRAYRGSPSFYKGAQRTRSGRRAQHRDLLIAMLCSRSSTFIQIVCLFGFT